MPDQRVSNLTLRIVSACVFVPGILALVKLGGVALLLLVLFIVGRSSWEFYHMAKGAGHRPASLIGLLLAVSLCVYVYVAGPENLAGALVAAVLLCLAVALRTGPEHYTANALVTLGGVIYLGFLGSAPLLIVRSAGPEAGTHLLLVLFVCVWLTDAAAYTCGRLWGRKKLAPRISPGKTVAGLIGGFGGGLLALFAHRLLPSFSLVELLGLLLLVSAGGQLGDLVESALKRDMGVKDTPALIPGHGGILDRFDSYFFAFPLAYVYIELLEVL